MMKKALVIGGSGFMGSHLADELTERGFEVTVYDHEKSPWLNPKQKFIQGDILNQEQLNTALSGMDVVYHYAGVADIGEAAKTPKNALNVNIMGTTCVLEACVKNQVKRIMFASTVYVYSDQGSFYRVSKQATESIIEAYQEKFGIDYTILRYGSLYGERSQAWNGLKKYITQALQDGRIDYRGTGKERREYIHVTDAARLSVDALDHKYLNKSLTLTGNEVFESLQLMRLIEEIVGKKIDIQLKELPEKNDHYEMTPYRYSAKPGIKVVLNEFVDLGQGILRLVEEVAREVGKHK